MSSTRRQGPADIPAHDKRNYAMPAKESSDAYASSSTNQPAPAHEVADSPSTAEGIIDTETFKQIIDLDDDETDDFSRGMVWAYFSQASSTFEEMHKALVNEDLVKLSQLGHFLKGSSAALGVAKVQASCERMQHYGQRRDEEADAANADLSPEAALQKIKVLLGRVEAEYSDAEKWLKKWYEDRDKKKYAATD